MKVDALVIARRKDIIYDTETYGIKKEMATELSFDFYVSGKSRGLLIWWITYNHRINCGGSWSYRLITKVKKEYDLRFDLLKFRNDVFSSAKCDDDIVVIAFDFKAKKYKILKDGEVR